LLVEIRIPAPAARSGGAYFKLERKVGDFATAAVAAQLTLRSDGAVEQAGIALTNVGLTPIKAVQAETSLRGKRLDDATIAPAAQTAIYPICGMSVDVATAEHRSETSAGLVYFCCRSCKATFDRQAARA